MPIYAYRCTACGYHNDYLQKLSEPVLTDCPECGKSTFAKQVTAAGFQLKGTGWYATDFKNKGSAKGESKKGDKAQSDKAESGKADTGAATEGGGSTEAGACGAGACPACT
jgi:putative FmdB family regulatory protein